MTKNRKSDVAAKNAFIKHLQDNGFTAKIAASPTDIIAERDGETWYFEIKMTKTSNDNSYFGAATLTEWHQALLTPEHFRFVVAHTDETETHFSFKEYTPKEFMSFSTVPPFKIFFSIPPSGQQTPPERKRRTAVVANEDILKQLDDFYSELKKKM